MTSRVPTAEDDTIAAIATGLGGGISIIRLAGPEALAIAGRVWRGPRRGLAARHRCLLLGRLVEPDGRPADTCLAVYMPGPRSYTGDDVVELHCHGGPMVAHRAMALLLAQGARHAEPGEYTLRAFLNGRMDLTQAEAVLDVIEAQSDMALHAANRQLQGLLGRRVEAAYASLTLWLAEIEVRMDFVDEDLDWTSGATVAAGVEAVRADLQRLLAARREGEILRDGIRLVLAGAPNAGKSSLLNLLLGRDRAIVTDVPGTTRDTLEEPAQIRGIPVRLTDTAGIREGAELVERHGIARSVESIRQSRVVLWVLDPALPLAPQRLEADWVRDKGVIPVLNKQDLGLAPAWLAELPAPPVRVSALTGDGLEDLRDAVERAVWGRPHTEEPDVALNARHAALLEETLDLLDSVPLLLEEEAWELLAINLRGALDALGRITGKTLQPDILATIFHKFCIGK